MASYLHDMPLPEPVLKAKLCSLIRELGAEGSPVRGPGSVFGCPVRGHGSVLGSPVRGPGSLLGSPLRGHASVLGSPFFSVSEEVRLSLSLSFISCCWASWV